MPGNTSPQTTTLPSEHASPAPQVSHKSPTLKQEVDALRSHMNWLQDAIAASDSIDQRIKLGRAYQESGYCLARLLRTQHLLHRGQDTEWQQAVNEAIAQVLKEKGRL